MAFFRFSPDLINEDDLQKMSVGRDRLVQDSVERITNAVHNHSTVQILFLGPRGIGKSHTLLRIFHQLSRSNKMTVIRLAEEEYSISGLDGLCQRVLETLNIAHSEKDITSYCRNKLRELKDKDRTVVLFVENMQMLFDQIHDDLGKLRSIIQSDQSLCIVGSALTYFDSISYLDEPFYRFFEINYLRGLAEEQVSELIKKRFVLSKKEHLIKTLTEHAGRIKGIHLLTGGNPRLIHILAEIIVQKNSLEDLERNLLQLLDQLTPFYQARMETISRDQRRLFDTIALSDGPMSPTEIARQLNIKPAVVVSQLRRLQKDGLVETVKFSNKKGTRYQIVERLYRIWRELRSTHGASKVKLFVDFMKLWYSNDELLNELRKTATEFDELYVRSKKEAFLITKKMCYILNAHPAHPIISLDMTVRRLILLNQLETAHQEIQKIRDLNNLEKNQILQKSGDVLVDIIELGLFTDPSTGEYHEKRQSVMDKIKKLNAQKAPIPDDQRLETHMIYEVIAIHLISNHQYDRALYFNDIAYDCVKDCNTVLNQRAFIKTHLKHYEEALEIINEILEREPEDAHALSSKVFVLTALKQQDLAVKASKQLLKLGIEYFAEASKPFVDFRLKKELLEITRHYKKSILKMNPEKRSKLLQSYIAIISHQLLHVIIDKKDNERQFFISVLSSIKDIVEAEDVTHGCAEGVLIYRKEINAIHEALSVLLDVFGLDKLRGLLPVTKALEYIWKGDPVVLEKLHPEVRQLTIQIVQELSPDTRISKEVLESVSV